MKGVLRLDPEHMREQTGPAGAGTPMMCEPAVWGVPSQTPSIRATEALRRRIGASDRMPRLTVEQPGAEWMVVLPSANPPDAEPAVERVVSTAPAPSEGLALWCTMATLAQQLARANASQASVRHTLERECGRLIGENGRLVARLEEATAALASQAEEHARASRRARWIIYGLSLVVAGLGALLLVLGPLATVGRLGA
jgi:hypothetical protein